MKRRLSILLLLLMSSAAEARCGDLWCAMCARRYGVPAGLMLLDGPGWGRLVRANSVQQPTKTSQPKLVIDATPQSVVDGALAIVRPRPDEQCYDLGCGDGRVVETLVRDYGCHAVGIEIRPQVAELAIKRLKAAKLDDRRWLIDVADATGYRYPAADVVFMYLHAEVIAKLLPKLTHCRAVISVSHEIPEATPYRIDKHTVWIRLREQRFMTVR